MDRRRYWNEEYTKYWKSVTDEANQKNGEISKVKKTTDGDFKTVGVQEAVWFFDKLFYEKSEKILDYGCGFGRFFSYFNSRADYYGIDISESMIKECRKNYPEYAESFYVAEGEKLPFANGFFDKVICYGVFDACYQEQAWMEMLRVTKKEGIIFLTGKNYFYEKDDEQAYIAEEAARKKGHPNYFTNTKLLIESSKNYVTVEHSYFFKRRGDMRRQTYVVDIPERFYEYVLVFRKKEEIDDYKIIGEKFSDAYSKTWKERNR